MTQLGEMVEVAAGVDPSWTCPFDHSPRTHNEKNVLPPPSTKNNASTLSDSLDAESKGVANITIRFNYQRKRYTEDVQFTAHHIIPGNEAWPTSELNKWIDHRKSEIVADIGYDVNAAYNGVDLPGHTAASGWSDPGFQTRYAFGAIVADKKKRQFHDRHAAYSDFVVKVLDKIATKLEMHPSPGCGKKHCGGSKAKPYDPPYSLLARLMDVALRLERKVTGDSRKWKEPVFTSRFALMFKNRGLSQDQARKQLETDQFIYP